MTWYVTWYITWYITWHIAWHIAWYIAWYVTLYIVLHNTYYIRWHSTWYIAWFVIVYFMVYYIIYCMTYCMIYYSPKHSIHDPKSYRKFTSIGTVQDDAPYQVGMGNGFKPFRCNIRYFTTKHQDIKPLISILACIQNKKSWGYVFRYGFLEIDKTSFEVITNSMLGFNPNPWL